MLIGKQGAMMRFWSQNFWVITFCVCTMFTYFHFVKDKKAAILQLSRKLQDMVEARDRIEAHKKDLELRLASQDDPAWIEMVLMRDLGVVPDGFIKVHFKG